MEYFPPCMIEMEQVVNEVIGGISIIQTFQFSLFAFIDTCTLLTLLLNPSLV